MHILNKPAQEKRGEGYSVPKFTKVPVGVDHDRVDHAR